MNTVYQVAVGAAVRFIRADSTQEALELAKNVWGDAVQIMTGMGQVAPDIGRRGYFTACNQDEKRAEKRDYLPMYAEEEQPTYSTWEELMAAVEA